MSTNRVESPDVVAQFQNPVAIGGMKAKKSLVQRATIEAVGFSALFGAKVTDEQKEIVRKADELVKHLDELIAIEKAKPRICERARKIEGSGNNGRVQFLFPASVSDENARKLAAHWNGSDDPRALEAGIRFFEAQLYRNDRHVLVSQRFSFTEEAAKRVMGPLHKYG